MKKFFVALGLLFFLVAVQAAPFYLLSADTGVSTIPAKPFPGDTVNLILKIENFVSDTTAYDVNLSLQLNEEIFEPVDVTESLGIIQSNSSKQAGFRFKINDGAIAGRYVIPVQLSYLSGTTQVIDYADVNILVNECFGLDVTGLSYRPERVYAGEKIIVSGNAENICSGSAREVSIELVPVTNTSFDPFILLSSNVVELGNISPHNSERFSFELQPVANSDPKVYVFELNVDCLDCTTAVTEKVSFEVLGKPWIIVSGTDLSIEGRTDAKNLLQGESFSFSVQADNIGEEKAKAVKVHIMFDDDSITGSGTAFVGNIDPDDSGAAVFDFTVKPSAPVGMHPAKIQIEFVDETGSVKTVEENFVFFVNERPPESPVFLIILLIVLLVALFFVLRLVFRQMSLRKANLK